ncbi:MAG: hypothetical protein K5879_04015 [Lachnospiraceae bacterium]|nr:hypothetical protein [Lachnospiraceae bacterium]
MLGRIRAVKAIRHLLFGVHILLMGLLLLSFPVRAENKYEPLRVGIPVFCAELKNDPGHIYHIRISPLAKNNPLPTAQTLDLQGGKDGAF